MLRKAVRAALYTSVVGLVVAWSVLGPKHQVAAQSAGTNIPAAQTVHAIPIPHKKGLLQGPGARVDHPLLTMDPVALAKAKAAANDRAAAYTQALGPVTSSPTRPYGVYNGTNFAGIASDTTSTPSDSTGAVGPNNYVEMVNSYIQVRTRAGVIVSTAHMYQFAVASTDCVFDPQITWDQQAGRWLYTFDDQVPFNPGTQGACNSIAADYVDFGWSITSDPSDLVNGWCQFGFRTDVVNPPSPPINYFFDYPKLGHDNNFINIGANVYDTTGLFRTATITSIIKPANWADCNTFPGGLIFGQPNSPLLNGDSTQAFTPVPADTADSSSVGYVVAAHVPQGSSPGSKITVWQISSSGGSPVLGPGSDVTVNNYLVPPAIPQPVTVGSCSATGNCLDSLDSRLTQAVAHYDPDAGKETIWTQHAVNDLTGALSYERWYELAPGSSTPRQQGDISDSALYMFNGAVSPTLAGNEAMIFYNAGNATAVTGYASFRVQSRNSLTAPSTMTNETILATGSNNDNDFSCGVNLMPPNLAKPCRWGDYSAARPDPTSTNAVWGTIMMTGTGGSIGGAGWATQVAAYTPGCATATANLPSLSTAPIGSIIAVGATSAGCSSPRFAFYLQYPDGHWALQQAFGVSNTWSWDTAVGFPAGTYNIHAWANQLGDSTATFEAFGAASFTLTVAPACTNANTTPPTSAVPAGTMVNFTTTSSTCPIPQYAYYIQDPTGTWTLKRPFSSVGTYAWDTTGLAPGNYNIHVWVTQRGHSMASAESLGTATVAINICTGASIAPPSQSAPTGGSAPMTASSTGCTTPQYQWYVQYPDGTWHLARAWGGATFSWSAVGLAPGLYHVHVWANDIGDPTALPEAVGAATVTLTGCTGGTVSGSPPSPQVIGTLVTFSTTATCTGTPVYEFWLGDPNGAYTMKQAFSTTSSWGWDTTGYAPGIYTIHVWINNQNASTTAPEANVSTTFKIQLPPPCAGAGVLPTTATKEAGATVDFTASSTTCTSPKYAYYAQYPDGSWNLLRTYGAAAFSWSTAGLVPGSYLIHLWASSTGIGYDSLASATVTLTGCTSASLTPANPSRDAGTTVTLNASSLGCTAPQYEFWAQYLDGTWHMIQPFGTATLSWNTAGFAPGTYPVHVWANQTGASTVTWEANGSDTVILTGCTTGTLTPQNATGEAGSTVGLTATAGGGCATPQFEFWVQYLDATWHLIQPWGTGTFNWNTAGLAPGTYTVHVWGNATGASTVTWEVNVADMVKLSGCTTGTLTPQNATGAAGSMVVLNATATGCSTPQFEFWVQYLDGTWHLAQPWGGAAFNWTTTGLAPGTYTVHAWANETGASTATWESNIADTVKLTGCTSATVTPASGSAPVGTKPTFTVAPVTCSGTPVYKFWLEYPDGTWHMMRDWGIGNSWQWDSTGFPKGNYVLHVWVNNQGADTTTFEVFGVATYTLT